MVDVRDAFSQFDHNDPELTQHAYDTYAALRAGCPVAHSDRYGGFYVVSRYEDVCTVAEHPEAFSNDEITIPPGRKESRNIPGFLDPPEHGPIRTMIAKPFAPARVLAMEARIRRI